MPKFPQGSQEELENRFLHHVPKGNQATRYEAIRRDFLELALGLTAQCPASRELSLSLTKLEESMFYALGAIARNE